MNKRYDRYLQLFYEQMLDILRQKLAKRGIDLGCLEEREAETVGSEARQTVLLRKGIESDLARKLVKMIKGSKLFKQAMEGML